MEGISIVKTCNFIDEYEDIWVELKLSSSIDIFRSLIIINQSLYFYLKDENENGSEILVWTDTI